MFRSWRSCLLCAVIGLAVQTAPAATLQSDDPHGYIGLSAAAGASPLWLLGEMHGTGEIPRWALGLVRHRLAQESVVFAFEMPRSEQPALDRYLDSQGGPADRAALRAGPWWQVQSPQHDGRRSEDLLDLIEGLRQLRADAAASGGHSLRMLAFDLAPGTPHDHHSRDRLMADYLVEQFARIPARWLVLTGNVHAMRQRPATAPREMQQPMGSYLAHLRPFSLRLVAREGSVMMCIQGCAARPLPALPASLGHGPEDGGSYDWRIVLPRFSDGRLLSGAPAADRPDST